MNSIPKQLTVKEASKIYNISENTLRAYVHRKIIPYRKLRGRVYFVTEVLEKWLAGFDVEPRDTNQSGEND